MQDDVWPSCNQLFSRAGNGDITRMRLEHKGCAGWLHCSGDVVSGHFGNVLAAEMTVFGNPFNELPANHASRTKDEDMHSVQSPLSRP